MLENFAKNLETFTEETYASFKKDELQILGIAGFYLSAKIRETTSRSATLTNNYVEDGSYVSDNIILDPLGVTIEGQVSAIEIKDKAETDITTFIQDKTADIVSTLYTIERSVQAVQRIRDIATSQDFNYKKLVEGLEQGETLYNLFTGNRKDIIQNFDEFMTRIWQSKLPITIETYLKNYDNMVIVSYFSTKNIEDTGKLDYSVTFQQARYAKTILTKVKPVRKQKKNPTGSMKNQTAETADKGVTNGKKVPTSLLSDGISLF